MRWRQIWTGLRNALDTRDVFVFGGLAALAYGIAQVHVPAAWIVCGALMLAIGVRR